MILNESDSSAKAEVQLATFSEKPSPLIQPVLTKKTSKSFYINLYQHYQIKGQGPIFVFMLIGIVLLVAGFGYLTQLLVSELGAGSKTLLLFVVAISITLLGVYLAKLALAFIGCGLVKLSLVDAANALLWQKVALSLGLCKPYTEFKCNGFDPENFNQAPPSMTVDYVNVWTKN